MDEISNEELIKIATSNQSDEQLSNDELIKIAQGALNPRPPSSSMSKTARDVAITGAIGYGAYRIGKKIYEPFPKARAASRALTKMKNELGIQDAGFERVPQVISENAKIDKTKIDLTIKELGIARKTLENKDLRLRSEELAEHIVKKVPEVRKIARTNYGNAISEISDLAEQNGFNISTSNFDSEVVNKTIDDLVKSGANPEDLKSLNIAKDNLAKQSRIVSVNGQPMGTRLSIKEAEGIVSKAVENDPFGKPAALLRKNWETFVSERSPQQIKPLLDELHLNYKQSMQAENLINKFVDGKTGTFDLKEFSTYISEHAIGKRNKDVEDAIAFLAKGNKISPPIEGVIPKFEEISKIRTQREALIKNIQGLQGSLSKNAEAVAQKLKVAKDTLSVFRNQQARIANRVTLGLRPVMRAIGVPLRAIAPIPPNINILGREPSPEELNQLKTGPGMMYGALGLPQPGQGI